MDLITPTGSIVPLIVQRFHFITSQHHSPSGGSYLVQTCSPCNKQWLHLPKDSSLCDISSSSETQPWQNWTDLMDLPRNFNKWGVNPTCYSCTLLSFHLSYLATNSGEILNNGLITLNHITSNTRSCRSPSFKTSEKSDLFWLNILYKLELFLALLTETLLAHLSFFMQYLSYKLFRTLLVWLITSQCSCMWPSHWDGSIGFLLQQKSNSWQSISMEK